MGHIVLKENVQWLHCIIEDSVQGTAFELVLLSNRVHFLTVVAGDRTRFSSFNLNYRRLSPSSLSFSTCLHLLVETAVHGYC